MKGRVVQVKKTVLQGVLLITPKRFRDFRGFFSESWSKCAMAEHDLDHDWVQDNHSLSSKAGTLRGLHFQAPPHAQEKLVRCGRGALFDVAVDIRKGSDTYGQWVGYELSYENGRQLLIPEGFLHGFVTLEPDTEIIYKCSDYYAPECERAVRFDSLDIDWKLNGAQPVLSQKDGQAQAFKYFNSPFVWGGTS